MSPLESAALQIEASDSLITLDHVIVDDEQRRQLVDAILLDFEEKEPGATAVASAAGTADADSTAFSSLAVRAGDDDD